MDIRAESMEVFVDPDTPWGDSYDGSPFKKGTGQRAVAERAATIFKKPELADIGGFFYRIHSVRDRVSDYFVTNLCNRVHSFHLETSSFYKCNSYPKFPFVIEGEAWLGGLQTAVRAAKWPERAVKGREDEVAGRHAHLHPEPARRPP